jgi:hypothetical protein
MGVFARVSTRPVLFNHDRLHERVILNTKSIPMPTLKLSALYAETNPLTLDS